MAAEGAVTLIEGTLPKDVYGVRAAGREMKGLLVGIGNDVNRTDGTVVTTYMYIIDTASKTTGPPLVSTASLCQHTDVYGGNGAGRGGVGSALVSKGSK